MKDFLKPVLFFLGLALLLTGCSIEREYAPARPRAYVKDNKPSLWISDHPRVRRFRAHYMKTNTVEKALKKGRKFMPSIAREFKKLKLPEELAYLPMLESMFGNRADSGHAKGMWQFTPQTAKEVGLRVGLMVDERLNWRKATKAAARYLDAMGKKFHYKWDLALAAYNGGPNYIAKHIRRQKKRNFWDLRLRKETAEYVPRFIAMLQVAREKYPHLMVAAR